MGCNTSQEKATTQVSDETNEEQPANDTKAAAATASKSDVAGDNTAVDNSHNVVAEIKAKPVLAVANAAKAVECNGNGVRLVAPAAEAEDDSLTEAPLLNGEPMGKDEGEWIIDLNRMKVVSLFAFN